MDPREIAKQLRARNEKFVDKTFPAAASSLYSPQNIAALGNFIIIFFYYHHNA